jgi:hypothetical protein
MGEIVDLSRMYIRNTDGDYDLETELHQDISDDLEYAKQLRNQPGNGFWDGRTGRQVGNIPNLAWFQGLQAGYGLEDNDRHIQARELKRFLNDHPEHRTVPHINTPGHTGRIIVK